MFFFYFLDSDLAEGFSKGPSSPPLPACQSPQLPSPAFLQPPPSRLTKLHQYADDKKFRVDWLEWERERVEREIVEEKIKIRQGHKLRKLHNNVKF
jgi:hypothetical protein